MVTKLTIKDLIGEWSLSNFEIQKKNKIKKAWRNNMHGILIYTSSGYMSVSINGNDNPTSHVDTNQSILFYAGTYKITHNNAIIHHVMNASDVNRIGKAMVRELNWQDSELKLIAKGNFGTAIITWIKIQKLFSNK